MNSMSPCRRLTFFAVMTVVSALPGPVSAQLAPPTGASYGGSVSNSAEVVSGIAWFGVLQAGLDEAQRTGKPILFTPFSNRESSLHPTRVRVPPTSALPIQDSGGVWAAPRRHRGHGEETTGWHWLSMTLPQPGQAGRLSVPKDIDTLSSATGSRLFKSTG